MKTQLYLVIDSKTVDLFLSPLSLSLSLSLSLFLFSNLYLFIYLTIYLDLSFYIRGEGKVQPEEMPRTLRLASFDILLYSLIRVKLQSTIF